MLPETRLAHIAKMESILNNANDLMIEMQNIQEKWRTLQPEIQQLIAYYQSEKWQQDYIADEQGLIPTNMPRGVLGQDYIYDMITTQHSLALDWIKLSVAVLESSDNELTDNE